MNSQVMLLKLLGTFYQHFLHILPTLSSHSCVIRSSYQSCKLVTYFRSLGTKIFPKFAVSICPWKTEYSPVLAWTDCDLFRFRFLRDVSSVLASLLSLLVAASSIEAILPLLGSLAVAVSSSSTGGADSVSALLSEPKLDALFSVAMSQFISEITSVAGKQSACYH